MSATAQLNILDDNISIMLEQGDTTTLDIKIKNEGTTALSNFQFTHNIKLLDNDQDEIIFTFSDPGTIDPGASEDVHLTIDTDSLIDFNTYKGTITATSGSESDTVPLTITIAPITCDSGIQGDDLVLTIEKPDTGDDFKPGEIITIKTNVKNEGTQDIDVKVEAFLFGDQDEIKGASSRVMNVDNGEKEDFDFDLTIPIDSREIESDKNYVLVIKAFDDDGEDNLCTQETVSTDIKLDSNDVIFDEEETSFSPSAVTCGEPTAAVLTVANIGDEEQEDAYFTLSNKQLGISQRSSMFDIDDFESDENHIITRRVPIIIPTTVKAGTYNFDAAIHYAGKTRTLNLPLIITSCTNTPTFFTAEEQPFKLQQNSYTVTTGETVIIPVTVTNMGATANIFSITLTNAEDYAQSIDQMATLGPQQTQTIFLTVTINRDALHIRNSGNIVVQTQGMVIGSEDIYFDIQPEEKASFFDSILNAPLWFIIALGAVIILALVALVWALAR